MLILCVKSKKKTLSYLDFRGGGRTGRMPDGQDLVTLPITTSILQLAHIIIPILVT